MASHCDWTGSLFLPLSGSNPAGVECCISEVMFIDLSQMEWANGALLTLCWRYATFGILGHGGQGRREWRQPVTGLQGQGPIAC